MILYGLAFGLLVVEMIICTFIVVPLPLAWREKALHKLAHLWNTEVRVRITVNLIMAAVLALFADSVWGIYRITAATYFSPTITGEQHAASGTIEAIAAGPNKAVASHLFEDQRNAFMSLFILFLYVLIYRFQRIIHKVALRTGVIDTSDEKSKFQEGEAVKIKADNERLIAILKKRGVEPAVVPRPVARKQ